VRTYQEKIMFLKNITIVTHLFDSSSAWQLCFYHGKKQ
jgi:hypothetical protein